MFLVVEVVHWLLLAVVVTVDKVAVVFGGGFGGSCGGCDGEQVCCFRRHPALPSSSLQNSFHHFIVLLPPSRSGLNQV